ncbi:MAG: ABC-type transport auxiliary lipoprotein family protein [Gammaproteobacteria bacterium]|nr:ABC-type transport auxiliary lipoprotein family protein [Gammaproteobacteria bacterium]
MTDNQQIKNSLKMLSVFVLMTMLTGCFGLGSKADDDGDGEPHYYIVDVDRGVVASAFPKNRVLLIQPVRVTSHYRSKSLVFRIGENEYQTQKNHLFFSEPQTMFIEQLKRWLQKSGQFSHVTTDESVAADMVLESAVTALYGDKREAFSPQAVLEMQFFLMDGQQNTSQALFQAGLKVEVDIEETTANNVVKGWKQGLEQLLATLEDDFSGYFLKRNP